MGSALCLTLWEELRKVSRALAMELMVWGRSREDVDSGRQRVILGQLSGDTGVTSGRRCGPGL